MNEMIVEILVELLSTLALTTKEIKRGKLSESIESTVREFIIWLMNEEKLVRKLVGEKKMEEMVQRLDRLTKDEALQTVAEILKVVHGLVGNMKVVMGGEQIHQACRLPGVENISRRRQGVGGPS
jgi:hypothetical protein